MVVSLSDLREDTGTLFFPDQIQTQHSQTQLHKEESLFFVKGMLMTLLVAAGVSDDVAQVLQCRLAHKRWNMWRVLDQHSLTHFPSQPWCKVCVESRGRDSPHREQSKTCAVVPQFHFDYGYMEDGGPLQIACFLEGTDTSSGATHATTVPDSKKMDMPYVVAGTVKWVRDLLYSQHTENQRHELRRLDIRSFDVREKRTQRSDDSIPLRHMDDVAGTGPANIS